jgi:hypothetical protein
VLEALVALLLGSLVVALSVGTFARQRAAQAGLTHRAEALDARRVARHLLRRELRGGDGSEEVGDDTLALRAYRGVGVVCAAGLSARELVVRVEGVRAPEPAKDSVRVRGMGGAPRVLALVARRSDPTACPGASRGMVERWRLSGAVPAAPLVARYFERGSYHLDGAALRYRRGAAGRQPITPQVLRTPPSRFLPRAGRAPTVELFLVGDTGSTPSAVLSLGGPEGPPGG